MKPPMQSLGPLVALICAVVAGCGKEDPEKHRPVENLRMLAIMCGKHLGAKGKMPDSLAELKKFAQSSPEPGGAPKDIDNLFVSPRDKEPYVLVRTAKISMPGVGAKAVMIHEQTGVQGRRLVAYTTSEIEEVDEARFTELVAKK